MSKPRTKNKFDDRHFGDKSVPDGWPSDVYGKELAWDAYNATGKEMIARSLLKSGIEFFSGKDFIELLTIDSSIRLFEDGTWEYEW